MASTSSSRARVSNSQRPQRHRSIPLNGHSPALPPRRSISTPNRRNLYVDLDSDPGRVRVAIRVRPRNAKDLIFDTDFADCVELQPELKRLKLKKNNWDSDSYKFDEVFVENASQRRVYEVVAKPVVESVLSGYNGTVMAYGQTGTGKTYTLGRLGKDDASERGIMVRAMEDIMAGISPAIDSIEVSYLQLYLESIQDLLAPEKTNIRIIEDSKTGEVTLPGAQVVKICNLDHFFQLLQTGESNRHAANTKMNTESSRSHAILMVHIRRSVQDEEKVIISQEIDSERDLPNSRGGPTVRKSKLLIVDLAGSERVNKSGSQGHLLEEAKFINLSLTSLGKCINALAENSSHVPTRDSKLTRLLRDSFGGSARTSLIITIGPSTQHQAETTSTILFGQRAMKIVNIVKLKEEFDYEGLYRNLENEVEHLNVEIDRQQKLREDDKIELERKLTECQQSFAEEKKCLVARSEQCLQESSVYQRKLAETTQIYEKTIKDITRHLEEAEAHSTNTEKELNKMRALVNDRDELLQHFQEESTSYQKALADTTQMYQKKVSELTQQLDDLHACFENVKEELETKKKHLTDHQHLKQSQLQVEIDEKLELNESHQLHQKTATELELLKSAHKIFFTEKVKLTEEVGALQKKLFTEENLRKSVETELYKLKKIVSKSDDNLEAKKSNLKGNIANSLRLYKTNQSSEKISDQRTTIAKYCEEVGLEKILKSLTSKDIHVQIHAGKVVANLAAEDIIQEKIVEEGGLDALLGLLQSSQSATVLRVASGAIANLAMNEINQTLIVNNGGAQLLANTASETDDPQTLRMVAGAIANLCGNEKLHHMLTEDGATKALLGMARSGNCDVVAQIARGLANFAKCESRGIAQGHRKGHSKLIEDGALTWLIANSSIASSSSRHHIELAICHLAQNEENKEDFVTSGGVEELVRISVESTREDIRSLAEKMLKLIPLKAEREKIVQHKLSDFILL